MGGGSGVGTGCDLRGRGGNWLVSVILTGEVEV